MDSIYDWIGKIVSLHLYTKTGQMIGKVGGRVSDVSPDVDVGGGRKLNLALLVELSGVPDSWESSGGQKGEMWANISELKIESGASINLNVN